MLALVRSVLGPASYPTLQRQEVKSESQTYEPIDPRAPIVQPAAKPATKE